MTAVEPTRIAIQAGKLTGAIDREGFAWTSRRPADLVARGDLVDVRVRTLDAAKQTIVASLEQTPMLEGALFAIENRTGHVLAMVGGFNFGRSKFNRATQALRQVGSGFKPIVYTAAIDRGYTPASIIVDAPVSYPGGAGQRFPAPGNYDREFWGPVTLRRASSSRATFPRSR